jgi:hypothetical protein
MMASPVMVQLEGRGRLQVADVTDGADRWVDELILKGLFVTGALHAQIWQLIATRPLIVIWDLP